MQMDEMMITHESIESRWKIGDEAQNICETIQLYHLRNREGSPASVLSH